jgi:putative DNA primase/helicase
MSEISPSPTHNYVERLSEVQPEAFDPFWLNRLAFSTLAILEGDPGEGKSLVALDLCARFSTGRTMPDGSPGPGVGDTIFLQSEDSYAKATLPRLLALGGDQNRVFRWRPPVGADEPFRIPSQLGRLEAELKRTGARLVIIDPLVDFLDPGVSLNSDQSIRRALGPLRLVAERCNCLILMIRHLIKRILSRALYRGGGSIAITGVCRSCWLIGRDPDHPQRRVLAEQKGNYSAAQPSLAFELRTEGSQPAVPHWLGETHLGADDLGLRAGRPSPECDRAVAFLRNFLHDGPRLSADIWAAARERAFSELTLRSARKKLGIRFKVFYRDKCRYNYWLLEGQELPSDPDPEPDDLADFRAALDAQIKKFPRSCPLDEEPE